MRRLEVASGHTGKGTAILGPLRSPYETSTSKQTEGTLIRNCVHLRLPSIWKASTPPPPPPPAPSVSGAAHSALVFTRLHAIQANFRLFQVQRTCSLWPRGAGSWGGGTRALSIGSHFANYELGSEEKSLANILWRAQHCSGVLPLANHRVRLFIVVRKKRRFSGG